MIQRFLYNTLKQGLDAIMDNPTLLDDIFSQYVLSPTEITDIKTWFAAKPPHVKHQYARVDDEFPLYSIVLGSERETDLFIGNDGLLVEVDGSGYIGEDDPDFGADLKASLWQHSFQIHCVSEHPDGTQYLYEVAKAVFLIANLDDFGFFQTHFSGLDLTPSLAYLPSHLFARVLEIQGKTEFERVVRDGLEKAFKVRGIHIDGGSPSDPGPVKTLVGVKYPDELDE
jgi:hypothetical protein